MFVSADTNSSCLRHTVLQFSDGLDQWFSNFLHQVPRQTAFSSPSTIKSLIDVDHLICIIAIIVKVKIYTVET